MRRDRSVISRQPRRLLGRLLVAGAALVLSLVLIEGVARVAFPNWAPRTARLTDFWRYDPRYGWSHTPGVKGTFRSHGIDSRVVINAKGFRGPEVAYSRNPGRPRVLFLGDSYTWGFGVDFDDTFTTRLERLVPGLETVNLSVSGYSTDQELLLYRDEGRKYRADLVAVVVAYNDSLGNARTVEYAVYGKPAFLLQGERLQLINQPVAKPSIVTRTFTRLVWRSYILTQIHRAIYDTSVGQNQAHADAPAPTASLGPRTSLYSDQNWALTTRLLAELAHEIRTDGAEPLVVFADGIPPAPFVARSLAAQGVDSVILDNVLDQRDRALHLPDGLHWNPRGHARVAEALVEPISQKLPRLPH